ncbi:MAG: glycosyltransferase family 9 protein [Maribacter sp.]
MEKNRETHILVIRLSAMGDVAMTVPVLLGILKKYPNTKITMLTKPFYAPIFWGIKNVTVHAADVNGKHKGVFGLWRLFKSLKRLHVDGVADLHNVLRSTLLKFFFKLTKVQFVQLDKGREEKKSLTDPKRGALKPLKTTFERYAEVVEHLGLPIAAEDMDRLPKRSIPEHLKEIYIPSEKILIGIAPFAAFEAKMYPLHLMEVVLNELDQTGRYKIILFGGGPQEAAFLENWEKKFTNVSNVAGKLSFSEELALISNLRLMLAMDSGNAHLAALYGVPTVTLWGVTHPYAGFYPFGQPESNAILSDRSMYPRIPTSIYGNKYPAGYGAVMDTIEPMVVRDKILEVLEHSV